MKKFIFQSGHFLRYIPIRYFGYGVFGILLCLLFTQCKKAPIALSSKPNQINEYGTMDTNQPALPDATHIAIKAPSKVEAGSCFQVSFMAQDGGGGKAKVKPGTSIQLKDSKGEVLFLYYSPRCALGESKAQEAVFPVDQDQMTLYAWVENVGLISASGSGSDHQPIPVQFLNSVECVASKSQVLKLEFEEVPRNLTDQASFMVATIVKAYPRGNRVDHVLPVELYYQEQKFGSIEIFLKKTVPQNGLAVFNDVPAIRLPNKKIILIAKSGDLKAISSPILIRDVSRQIFQKLPNKTISVILNGTQIEMKWISPDSVSIGGKILPFEGIDENQVRIGSQVYQANKTDKGLLELVPIVTH